MGRGRTTWIVLLLALAWGCNGSAGDDGSSDTSGGTTNPSTTGDATTSDGTTGQEETTGDSGSSGASSSSDEGLIEADYETDIQPIFNDNCTCHLQGMSGTMQAPFMTLNPGMSHGQIVDVPSEQVPGMDRIEPGDPDASYLWHKINDTHLDVSGSGNSMPPGVGGVTLDPATLDLIEAWIFAGANP